MMIISLTSMIMTTGAFMIHPHPIYKKIYAKTRNVMHNKQNEVRMNHALFRKKKEDYTICHFNYNDNNNDNKNNKETEDTVGNNIRNSTIHDHTSSTTTSTSTTIYHDEECYDLCDGDNIFYQAVDNEEEVEEPKKTIMNQSQQTQSLSPPPQQQSKFKNGEPEPTKQVWQNLELHWSIDSANNDEDCDVEDVSTCSEPCLDCRGKGIKLCSFCHGVGYVDFGFAEKGTMGQRLLDNNNMKNKGTASSDNGRLGVECPVCDEDGEQSCSTCRGSGWIAKWRLDYNASDLRP